MHKHTHTHSLTCAPPPRHPRAGEPAPERITDKIYGETQKVAVLRTADIPDVDLSTVSAGVGVEGIQRLMG